MLIWAAALSLWPGHPGVLAAGHLQNGGFQELDARGQPLAWGPMGEGFEVDTPGSDARGHCIRCTADDKTSVKGALQVIRLDQKQAGPLLVVGWSKAERVSGGPNSDYSIYCDVEYTTDSRPGRVDLPGQTAVFPTGTHGWCRAEKVIVPAAPIKQVKVYALFRRHAGTVWFDDVSVGPLWTGQSTRPADLARHRLKTADGLQIDLAEDGQLDGLRIGGRDFTSPRIDRASASPLARGSGLYVGVMPENGFRLVAGEFRRQEQGVRQRASLRELGLEIDATWRAYPDRLEISGTVRDAAKRPRAVDVVLKLPVDLDGWEWSADLTSRQPLTAGPAATDFPLATVTSRQGAGLTLAVPPDRPCRYELSADPVVWLFQGRLKLGLSPCTQPPSTARFAMVLFRTDPEWGFRDALRHYYATFPESFRQIAPKEGGWLFAFPSGKLPNPEDYAFREGGPTGWEVDERLGLLTCPYRIPVQRQIVMPQLPADHAAATAEIARLAANGQEGHRNTEYAEMMLSCASWDGDGKPYIVRRDNVGADVRPKQPIYNVVYAVNPDPDLFADRDVLTVGRYELAKIDQMLRQTPKLDGIYLDSMTGWVSRYPNFRQQHFAYVDGPLTYDEATFRVCAAGWQHTYEFMRELQRRLRPKGLVVFPNLNLARRRAHFLYLVSDVIGLEGGLRSGTFEPALNYYRALAYQKPVLVMDYLEILGRPTRIATREGFEEYWKWCVLYGVHPSVGRECDEAWRLYGDVYRRYRDPLRRIAAAGWEPVTHARAGTPKLRLERFGHAQPDLFFTLMNPGREHQEVLLELDTAALGLPEALRATDLVTGGSRTSPFRLTLDGGELQVLRVEPLERDTLSRSLP